MLGKLYIRRFMLARISVETPHAETGRSFAGRDGLAGDNDRRRFRRMAEKRKQQILERMLLDAQTFSTDSDGEWRRDAHAR